MRIRYQFMTAATRAALVALALAVAALAALAAGCAPEGGSAAKAPPTEASSASAAAQAGGAAADVADEGAPQGAAGASADGGEKGLFPIRVITTTGYHEYMIGDELGFFADEGIQLEFIGTVAKGVTEMQLLEQGEIDAFISSHPPNVAQARLAGVHARAVVPGMIDDPVFSHVRYLVKPGSEIQKLTDIVGKKVQVSSVSACTTGYLQYFLVQNGFDKDAAEFVIMTDTEGIQALAQGLVDVAAAHPPYAGIAVDGGTAEQIASTWDLFESPGAGLSVRGFTDEFIAEHPDVVQGFVNAMYRTRLWCNDNLDDAKGIVAERLEIEPKDLSSFYYDPNKNIDPGYIEQWFELSESIELWAPGDVLPEDTYTNEFVPKDAPASDKELRWQG